MGTAEWRFTDTACSPGDNSTPVTFRPRAHSWVRAHARQGGLLSPERLGLRWASCSATRSLSTGQEIQTCTAGGTPAHTHCHHRGPGRQCLLPRGSWQRPLPGLPASVLTPLYPRSEHAVSLFKTLQCPHCFYNELRALLPETCRLPGLTLLCPLLTMASPTGFFSAPRLCQAQGGPFHHGVCAIGRWMSVQAGPYKGQDVAGEAQGGRGWDRGPDTCSNSLDEPLDRQGHSQVARCYGVSGGESGGRVPQAGLGWLVGVSREMMRVFPSRGRSDFLILATSFPSLGLNDPSQRYSVRGPSGAFGRVAPAWQRGREAAPGVGMASPPPPACPGPAALSISPEVGRVNASLTLGRAEVGAAGQMDWRLARSPQTHGAGLTAGDNISRGRRDALSGHRRALSES